jgi:hypothetical protein
MITSIYKAKMASTINTFAFYGVDAVDDKHDAFIAAYQDTGDKHTLSYMFNGKSATIVGSSKPVIYMPAGGLGLEDGAAMSDIQIDMDVDGKETTFVVTKSDGALRAQYRHYILKEKVILSEFAMVEATSYEAAAIELAERFMAAMKIAASTGGLDNGDQPCSLQDVRNGRIKTVMAALQTLHSEPANMPAVLDIANACYQTLANECPVCDDAYDSTCLGELFRDGYNPSNELVKLENMMKRM